MTRTPEQILCCPGGCVSDASKCDGLTIRWAEILSMPLTDRMTLARAIAPDGWLVAKVPDEVRNILGDDRAKGHAEGWMACRAAMLASMEAPNDE